MNEWVTECAEAEGERVVGYEMIMTSTLLLCEKVREVGQQILQLHGVAPFVVAGGMFFLARSVPLKVMSLYSR
jgi:hypothetical protein